jgi:hypothetical protein
MSKEMMRFTNKSLSQRSFRLRPVIKGTQVAVQDCPMVVVPGADPQSLLPGKSDPVPSDLVKACSDQEWLTQLVEEGILGFETVT